MLLKVVAGAFAVAATASLLAAPVAEAQSRQQRNSAIVYDARGRTVLTTRDEDGRARTRIIVQRRSYLDPGTEVFPGENSDHKYAYPSNYSASGVLNNTVFGGNQTSLPDMWTLPGRNNPWIGF
ncbi:MAG: hypothetical protein Q8M26_13645 [Pseudolabrys sp.]|nr:hypothetical protein [Pseudolabrys sp.]